MKKRTARPDKKKRPRRVGRPAAGDADGRNRILQAAREILREKGLAKLTLRGVATRAQVDVALISYHFGNKRGLYDELLVSVYEQIEGRMREAAALDHPTQAERIRAVIFAHILAIAEDPYAPSLVASIDAEYDEVPAQLSVYAERMFSLSNALFSQATASGEAPAIDPTFVSLAVGGMAEYFFMTVSYFLDATSRGSVTPELIEAWATFVAEFTLRGTGIVRE